MSGLTINDRSYTFGTLPPIEAIRVEVAIARVIGEPLFKAFMDAKKTGSTEADAQAAGAAAIGLLASKMDADELIKTIETVMKYVMLNGRRVIIEQDFNKRNKELWQVFIAALKENFSDFLPDGLSLLGQSKAPT
jgi:hypothetical protein